ncbi:MAG: ChaN family lipoprotein [Burkholderiales bacterium]|nr:ChaN family lipoprotein [Burkholderiales bacterium]
MLHADTPASKRSLPASRHGSGGDAVPRIARGCADFALRAVLGLASALAVATIALAATPLAATPEALADAMSGHRLVVLGEVHDNGAQHALRLKALKALVARGARPALAFEQFDRERQADIDRAWRERPLDAAYLIAQAKGSPNWNWDFYRPFVELALEFDLPIVAANLSRADAMRIAVAGKPDAGPAPDAAFMRAHERAIAKGHCDLLPASALPGMVQAQIARDRALAEAIRTYAARGVVLLTGNGHARIDIGVPHWFTADERAASISIGFLERGKEPSARESPAEFDAYVVTDEASRADPCDELRARFKPHSTQ